MPANMQGAKSEFVWFDDLELLNYANRADPLVKELCERLEEALYRLENLDRY